MHTCSSREGNNVQTTCWIKEKISVIASLSKENLARHSHEHEEFDLNRNRLRHQGLQIAIDWKNINSLTLLVVLQELGITPGRRIFYYV